MLRELVVESLGVIERAELSLGPGSTALTGETGAGKTLVVAAVGLLLGGRAERSLIRTGDQQARVEGRFVVSGDHPVAEVLVELGLVESSPPEFELVVARTVGEAGSKARVNGRIVTLAQLGDIVGSLVEVTGQNEHQHITSSGSQRRYLDSYAGAEAIELAQNIADEVRAAAEARRTASELTEGGRARSRELDVLRYEISEIEAAALEVGEADRLSADASKLTNAEAIATALSSGEELLRGEKGAEELLGEAEGRVRSILDADPSMAQLAQRLESARIEIADVAAELSARVVEPDPRLLAETRERLDVIAKMLRKYGDSESEVLSYLERARQRAAELDSASSDASHWEGVAAEAEARALDSANRLSQLRKRAANGLCTEISTTLDALALPSASFEVDLAPHDLYEGGLEAVTFAVSINKGEAAKPIAKAASGGELSRIALALHLANTSVASTTMIFDEVDSGVGGVAAQSVGRALADLARGSGIQVLVVTHLPQVAAFADNHLRVTKLSDGARTRAIVARVDDEERVEELSRMLAGLPESEVGQEHARELLALASGGASVA